MEQFGIQFELIQDVGGGVCMSGVMNEVLVFGNVICDFEICYIFVGDVVLSLLIVVNENYQDCQGQCQEKVYYIDVMFWCDFVENMKEFCKGDLVMIMGRFVNEGWIDKDGNKCNSIRVEVM